MPTSRHLARWILAILLAFARTAAADEAVVMRLPKGALQPVVATDTAGDVHMAWLQGEAGAADVFYQRLKGGIVPAADAVRVNSQPGSAVAVGTIRGTQIALGRNGEIHVVWNGSSTALPKAEGSAPLLYSRSLDAGATFSAQRNLGAGTAHLDGGASVAADQRGNVYVVWHASPKAEGATEAGRRVYVLHSTDAGASFGAPRIAPVPGGVCACCGLKAACDPNGRLLVLYRAAHATDDRPATLIASADHGQTFEVLTRDPWPVGTCPMSSAAFARAEGGMRVAWETLGTIRARTLSTPGTGSGDLTISEGKRNRHPALATGKDGRSLAAWAVGTGWQRGGSVAWRELNAAGQPTGPVMTGADLPVWSFPAAFVRSDGRFVVAY